jgi:type 1 glutamine amidotransferase
MSAIVVLTGDGEYGSATSLVPIAQQLRTEYGHEVDYRVSSVIEDMPDFPPSSFGDLDVLDGADLLIVFMRMRRLPDSEMEALERFCRRGGNILGLRTSSHAFKFADDSRWVHWNRWFGADVLGTPWVSHHGRDTSTQVITAPDVDHPILYGLPNRFSVRSWLYRVELAADCEVLLSGKELGGDGTDETPEPLAWIRQPENQRVFFTTLGHPEDLATPEVQLLLLNAAEWALADAP